MHRTLTILLRRDPGRDGMRGEIPVEGYQISWPDGRAVAVGLNAFCKHGLRLLGLKGCPNGCPERLVELICFPVADRDANLTRQPGHRTRRFCLARFGASGRLHFLDGSPTDVVFDLGRDDPAVLAWIGLPALRDGERQWLDLAARTADSALTPPRQRAAAEVTRPSAVAPAAVSAPAARAAAEGDAVAAAPSVCGSTAGVGRNPEF